MTRFVTPSRLLALALALSAAAVHAQPATPAGPAADDNAIFFVDGVNLNLAQAQGSIIDTTGYAGGSDTVLKFDYAANQTYALRYDTGTGRDFSDNVSDGDVIHFWINGTPSLQGTETRFMGDYSGVQIRLVDSFESTTEADLTNPAAKNLGFRLTFAVPDDLLDGTWHEVEIPFPPGTLADLDANRAQYATDDDLRQYLYYEGAEVFNSQGVGPAFDGSADNFVEFDYENVTGLYVAYEFEDATQDGFIMLDDVYIGDPDLDLAFAREQPAALAGASATADGNTARFAVPASDDYARYQIFMSENPITPEAFGDQSDFFGGLYQVATVNASDLSGDAVEFEFDVFKQYPTFGDTDLYFAVVGVSQYGVPNRDIGAGNVGSVTVTGERQGFLFEVAGTTADAILDGVDGNVVSLDPWSDALSAPDTVDPAFMLGQGRSKRTGGAADVSTDDDLSVPRMYVAYDDLGFVYVYGEVVDDVVAVTDTSDSTNLYEYDSVETYFGFYEVESNVFGQDDQSIFRGLARGETPDYQVKFSPRVDVNGDPAGMFIDALTTGYFFQNIRGGQLPDARGAWERTANGYRFMAYLEIAQLVNFPLEGPDTPDPEFLPGGDQVKVMPFNFTVNDNDETDNGRVRSTQLSWSVRYNTDGDLFRLASQWQPTAIVGRDALQATSAEDGPTVAGGLTLNGLGPNPARTSTALALALAAPSKVTVEVYDALGRRVAQPYLDTPMAAGAQSLDVSLDRLASGVYVVVVRAGADRVSGTVTVVR